SRVNYCSPKDVSSSWCLGTVYVDLRILSQRIAIPQMVLQRHRRAEATEDYDRNRLVVRGVMDLVILVEERRRVAEDPAIVDHARVEDDSVSRLRETIEP